MLNAGTIAAYMTLDTSKYLNGLNLARREMLGFLNTSETVRARVDSLGSSLSTFGALSTIGITTPIALISTATFKMASDVNESLNKTEVAFGDSSEAVKRWSNTTLERFGIAKGSALDMASLFGDMATGMRIPQQEASEMSKRLVELAGDLASFKNIGLDQATTALNGVFTGETESLKLLGVVMTQTNLEAFALEKGITKNIDAMTEAEKVQLRYAFILDRTKNSQGDFARTFDGPANQMRVFTEGLKELGASFGENLIPVFTPLIKDTNELIKSFGALDPAVKENIVKAGLLVAAVGPVSLVIGKTISAGSSAITMYKSLSEAQNAVRSMTLKTLEANNLEIKELTKKSAEAQKAALASASLASNEKGLYSTSMNLASAYSNESKAVADYNKALLSYNNNKTASNKITLDGARASMENATTTRVSAEVSNQAVMAEQKLATATQELANAKQMASQATIDFNTCEREFEQINNGEKMGDYVLAHENLENSKRNLAEATNFVKTKEIEEAVASNASSIAKNNLSGATARNTGINWLNVASLKAMAASMLPAVIIMGVVSAFTYLSQATERQKKKIDDLKQSHETANSEFEQTQRELQEVNEKITAIESHGSLKLTDNQELAKLKEQKKSLEDTAKAKQAIAQISLQSAIDEQMKLITSASFASKALREQAFDAVDRAAKYDLVTALEADLTRLQELKAERDKVNDPKDIDRLDEAIKKHTTSMKENIKQAVGHIGTMQEATEQGYKLSDAESAITSKLSGLVNGFSTIALGADKFSDSASSASSEVSTLAGTASELSSSLDDLNASYEKGEIDSEQYVNSLKNQLAEIKKQRKDMGALTKDNEEVAKSYALMEKSIKQNLAAAPATVKDLQNSTKSLTSDVSLLADALDEQKKSGKLSIDTALGLIEAGYSAAIAIDNETGAVTVNKDAYIAITKAKIQEKIVSLQISRDATIAKLQEEAKVVGSATDAYLGLFMAKSLEAQKNAADIDKTIATLTSLTGQLDKGIVSSGKSAASAAKNSETLEEKNKKLYDAEMRRIEAKRRMNKISDTEELAQIDLLGNKYKLAADDVLDHDVKMYDLKKALSDKVYDDKVKALEREKSLVDDETDKDMALASLKMLENKYSQLIPMLDEQLNKLFISDEEYADKKYELNQKILESQKDYNAIIKELNEKETEETMNKFSKNIQSIESYIRKQKELNGLVNLDGSVNSFTGKDEIASIQLEIDANDKLISTLKELRSQGAISTEDFKKFMQDRASFAEQCNEKIISLEVDLQKELQKTATELSNLYADTAKSQADAQSAYNKQVEEANRKLEEEIAKIKQDEVKANNQGNKAIIESNSQVTDNYEKELEARTRSLVNFADIFSEITKKDVSGKQLLDNLKGQFDTLKSWQENLNALRTKGVDKELMKELESKGADKAAEIAALNSLSEDEMNEYVKIYKEKTKIAKEEAVKQLADQKQLMINEASSIREGVTSQADTMVTDYTAKIKELEEKTAIELEKHKTTFEETMKKIKDASDVDFTKLAENISNSFANMSISKEDLAVVLQNAKVPEAVIAKVVESLTNPHKEAKKINLDTVKTEMFEIETSITESIDKKQTPELVRAQAEQDKQEQQKTKNAKDQHKIQETNLVTAQNSQIGIVESFAPKWFSAGELLGQNFLEGIISRSASGILDYINKIAEDVRDAQRGNSSDGWEGGDSSSDGSVSRSMSRSIPAPASVAMPMAVSMSIPTAISAPVNFARKSIDNFANKPIQEFSIDYDRLGKAVSDNIKDNIKPSINYSPVFNSPRQVSIGEQRREDTILLRRLGVF